VLLKQVAFGCINKIIFTYKKPPQLRWFFFFKI
jgi:hypothetical protein